MSQVLNPLTFPLTGARLIEASAGTGKTYTIAALYLRLILQHGGPAAFGQPLAPENILVVTFTKAATEELRDRIRRRLSEAARLFRGRPEGDPDPLLLALRNDFPEEQWPALAHRLELAASSMDEAAVHTIHGWAQRMLSRHAFDSGSRFNLRLEADDRELYREAARDYWRTFFYPLESSVLERLLSHVSSPEDLAKAIRLWPFTGEAEASGAGFLDELRQWLVEHDKVEAEARALWLEQSEQIEAWFEQAQAQDWLNRVSHKPEATRKLLDELHAWARGEVPFNADSHGKLSAGSLKLKGKAQPPDLEALRRLDALKGSVQEAPDIRHRLLSHARLWCDQRVAKAKTRLSVLCYDDLLNRLDEALAGPNGQALAALIRQRYPVALIDEFQDTDPVQYRMFRTIYLNQPETGLFMIGDPKQAIYGFRGADIYTYLQARNDTAGEWYTLDTNYRSVAPLVDAVNGVFQHAGRGDQGAFLFRDRIPFEPVRARGRAERFQVRGEALSGLILWHDAQPRAKDDYLRDLAAVTAGHILELLALARRGEAGFLEQDEFRPLAAADIAILVRDRHEARAIREALAQRGLRSAYLSDQESVYGSREAADLLFWLRAVAMPESESRVRLALATPTLGLPLAELNAAGDDDGRWEARIEHFLEYRRLWQQKGVLVMLTRLLADFQVPGRLLKAQQGGERSLTNLLQLGELLQQAAANLDGEQALIRYLAERIEEAEEHSSEEYVQRLESDEALIKVVTVHKSKGLEYPLVFLPFVGTCKPVNRKDRLYFKYHDPETGEVRYDYALSNEAMILADRERLAEDLRLLYVALTRARHLCWLGVVPWGSRTNNGGYSWQLHRSALGYVLSQGAGLDPDSLPDSLNALAEACGHIRLEPLPQCRDDLGSLEQSSLALEQALRASPRQHEPWWIASYSSLILGASMVPAEGEGRGEEGEMPLAEDSAAQAIAGECARDGLEPIQPAAEARSIHRFPKGVRSGIFLHGLLEWVARLGFDRARAEPELVRDQIARRCRRRGLEGWIEPLQEWLMSLLEADLLAAAAYPDGEVQASARLAAGTAIQPDLFEVAEFTADTNRLPPFGGQAGGLKLGQLDASRAQPEMEFWIGARQVDAQAVDALLREHIHPGLARPALRPQVLNGMLKGFIDLVFEHEGRFYVLDYKSNYLGPGDEAYGLGPMTDAILEHRYDLQYVLYCLALHRLLRTRMPDYDYERHCGGALYLFLRGVGAGGRGVYGVRPPRELIEALDRMFRMAHVQALAG